ncbi:amidase [Elstera sp.]|jgi:aspartyl-tRNA(Asn)/glutamyl-tRNA(Gln) amidotransferase subunit A|uniref:amidase n=1 Tax=Elstera sp. TaxID=1916664 RepID=UPI0037C19286
MPHRYPPQRALHDRSETAVSYLEAALARIEDAEGEGAKAFVAVHAETARAAAENSDRLRAAGIIPSPLSGLTVSIKDLLDEAGQVTRAGSVARDDAPPAFQDSPVVAQLRAAGAVIVGRTNMTEFAFSGLGLNPHYGTPRNPFGRELGAGASGRIPGGSSSGAAVSVSDGMAHVAIGSDTGGSVRIPAAFCGLVGFKPTARRVPLTGTLPLSTTLDSIGPLAKTVDLCAQADAILAGDPNAPVPAAFNVHGLRLLAPSTMVLDGMDATVAAVYERTLSLLAAAGARIVETSLPVLNDLQAIGARGGFSAPEAYAWHRDLLARRGDDYDPRVRSRIEKAATVTAVDYIEALALRAAFVDAMVAALAPYDAMIMPTVPIIAPLFTEVESDEDYTRLNLLALRNPAIVNLADGCALTLPCHRPGEPPVGVSLVGAPMQDRRILAIGRALEPLLRSA